MSGSCGRLGELGGKQAASVEPFLDTSQRLRRKDGNGFSGTNPVTHPGARADISRRTVRPPIPPEDLREEG